MIDQLHDPNHGYLKNLLTVYPSAYDAVKTASLEEDPDALPSEVFAWEEKRAYPLHTKEHAILSAIFAEHFGCPGDIRQKIAEALHAYDVDPEVLVPAQQKVAEASDDDYLFPSERLYPVFSADDVKTAEARLLSQLFKLSAEHRAEAFPRLLTKAAAFGASLEPLSYRLAGAVETHLAYVKEAVEARAVATKDPASSEAYDKLAAILDNYPPRLVDHGIQTKLASYLNDLDAVAGLKKDYDRRIQDPILTVFNTTRLTKIAGGDSVMLGDHTFPVTQLAGIPPSLYDDVLGPDFSQEVCPNGSCDPQRLVQVLETLPADMKAQLGAALVQALGSAQPNG